MPEIVEVEKLKAQLEPAWKGRSIAAIRQPASSPVNARKFFLPDIRSFRDKEITRFDRVGKFLWLQLVQGEAILLHLSSTGWLTPANQLAAEATRIDSIKDNFLHTVNAKNVRARIELDDGQLWNYHDSRTWGKFQLVQGERPGDNEQLASYGPDWLRQPISAMHAILEAGGRRAAKDLVCDQKITAGIGNYLAVEALHRAGIHPRKPWNKVTPDQKMDFNNELRAFLKECQERIDHSHWKVFGKAGETCPTCMKDTIQYVKDGNSAKRGSYYCPSCQPSE